MNNLSLINVDYSDVEDNSSNNLLNIMRYNIANANYDFMHGGLGIAFCYRNDKKMTIETLQALDKSAIKEFETVKWKSFLSSEKTMGYNISLSHGMSSIIIYLAEVYKRNIEQDLVKELLQGVLKYVLLQETDIKECGSCFPSLSLTNGELTKSRLAWCYDDLGVAAALWQAGESLGDKTICSKSIEVFKQCAYRRDIDKEIIMDAGICHGSAGIAMIFNYIYDKTGDAVFLEAYNYWLSVTLRLGTVTDGLCGFKKYVADGTDERIIQLRNEYDLSEGLAGIGLVLLSSISQRLAHDWRELFLLY